MALIKIPRKKVFSKDAKRAAKEAYAEQLKVKATASEKRLHTLLLARGCRFIFQSVLYGYIADFHFVQEKKIVELDGKKFHDKDKDKIRDENLKRYSIQTLRIKSRYVFTKPDWVINKILSFIAPKCPQTKSTRVKLPRYALKSQGSKINAVNERRKSKRLASAL